MRSLDYSTHEPSTWSGNVGFLMNEGLHDLERTALGLGGLGFTGLMVYRHGPLSIGRSPGSVVERWYSSLIMLLDIAMFQSALSFR